MHCADLEALNTPRRPQTCQRWYTRGAWCLASKAGRDIRLREVAVPSSRCECGAGYQRHVCMLCCEGAARNFDLTMSLESFSSRECCILRLTGPTMKNTKIDDDSPNHFAHFCCWISPRLLQQGLVIGAVKCERVPKALASKLHTTRS